MTTEPLSSGDTITVSYQNILCYYHDHGAPVLWWHTLRYVDGGGEDAIPEAHQQPARCNSSDWPNHGAKQVLIGSVVEQGKFWLVQSLSKELVIIMDPTGVFIVYDYFLHFFYTQRYRYESRWGWQLAVLAGTRSRDLGVVWVYPHISASCCRFNAICVHHRLGPVTCFA